MVFRNIAVTALNLTSEQALILFNTKGKEQKVKGIYKEWMPDRTLNQEP